MDARRVLPEDGLDGTELLHEGPPVLRRQRPGGRRCSPRPVRLHPGPPGDPHPPRTSGSSSSSHSSRESRRNEGKAQSSARVRRWTSWYPRRNSMISVRSRRPSASAHPVPGQRLHADDGRTGPRDGGSGPAGGRRPGRGPLPAGPVPRPPRGRSGGANPPTAPGAGGFPRGPPGGSGRAPGIGDPAPGPGSAPDGGRPPPRGGVQAGQGMPRLPGLGDSGFGHGPIQVPGWIGGMPWRTIGGGS
jgi:hypothetical protein